MLPGVAGHDLRIVRSYSSKVWGRTDLLVAEVSPLLAETEQSVLGYGWTFHFGRLRNPNASGVADLCSGDFPVFETPDGGTQVFYPVTNTPDVWLSKDFWRMERNCVASGSSGTCVWLPSGVRYEFTGAWSSFYGMTPMWPAVRIVDSLGNPIVVNYVAAPSGAAHAIVESVIDTYGRAVTFEYTTGVDGARLTSMTANGKTYSYVYTTYDPSQTGGAGRFPLQGPRRFLTKVEPPAGAGPGYAYTYAYSATVSANQYALSSITSPEGGAMRSPDDRNRCPLPSNTMRAP